MYTPDAALRTLWNLFPSLSGFRQQDAEEFLRCVLGRVNDEHSGPAGGGGSGGGGAAAAGGAAGGGGGGGGATAAARAGDARRLFTGAVVSSVTCSRCNHVSATTQPYVSSVSVSIPEVCVLRCDVLLAQWHVL